MPTNHFQLDRLFASVDFSVLDEHFFVVKCKSMVTWSQIKIANAAGHWIFFIEMRTIYGGHNKVTSRRLHELFKRQTIYSGQNKVASRRLHEQFSLEINTAHPLTLQIRSIEQ